MLALDLLFHDAKAYNGFGPGWDTVVRRDAVYNAILGPARGARFDLPIGTRPLRNHYGISKEDVPALRAYADQLWSKGIDYCKFSKPMTPFRNAVAARQIPQVCGISGSTNLAIWELLHSRAEFDEQQMRRFILSVWSTLCVDGGHTLQEVLSAARLISNPMQTEGFRKIPFNATYPMKTIESLRKVTQEINATGDPKDPSPFGNYASFFSKLDSPAFQKARNAAQKEMIAYVNESCH
jgi:hypothetical protein